MTAPFYAGQTDYIDKLNELYGTGEAADAAANSAAQADLHRQSAAASADSAEFDRQAAAASATNAGLYAEQADSHRQAAAASASLASAEKLLAASYASQAQATNPDSPIRLNPSRIAANFTVPTGYNATSTGPITVADGVAVTVSSGAAWSVH